MNIRASLVLDEEYGRFPDQSSWVNAGAFLEDGARGLEPPRRCEQWGRWANDTDGVFALNTVWLRAVVQGTQGHTVLVDGLEVEVERSSPPSAGVAALCWNAGGADASPRQISVDLDHPTPVVQYFFESDLVGRELLFTLGNDETEIFDIKVTSRYCVAAWSLALRLVVDGERVVVPIDLVDDVGGPLSDPVIYPGASAQEIHEWDGRDWGTPQFDASLEEVFGAPADRAASWPFIEKVDPAYPGLCD